MPFECTQIGTVRSELKDKAAAPKMGEEGAPSAFIDIDPAFAPALEGVRPGDEVVLLTWLHQADRATLQCHPRGDAQAPMRGVFSTRSPDRPTPVGLHRVRVLALQHGVGETGPSLQVHPLEAVDGTPVIDIKARLKPRDDERSTPVAWGPHIPARTGQAIADTCRDAWGRGLLSGFNGNVSVREGSTVIVTCRGAAKGHLRPGNLTALDLATGKRLAEGRAACRASSETPLHLALYDLQPQARAVVHTHPPHLLALSLLVPEGDVLSLPLFECDFYREKFAQVPDLQPGTQALAREVALAARDHQAVFLRRHGLVCWGEDLTGALGLTEEIESLARVQLMTLQAGRPLDEPGEAVCPAAPSGGLDVEA